MTRGAETKQQNARRFVGRLTRGGKGTAKEGEPIQENLRVRPDVPKTFGDPVHHNGQSYQIIVRILSCGASRKRSPGSKQIADGACDTNASIVLFPMVRTYCSSERHSELWARSRCRERTLSGPSQSGAPEIRASERARQDSNLRPPV